MARGGGGGGGVLCSAVRNRRRRGAAGDGDGGRRVGEGAVFAGVSEAPPPVMEVEGPSRLRWASTVAVVQHRPA
jgi:hypothetical protein